MAVDSTQANLARDAFRRFGQGRSASALNYGDCFSYALAAAPDQRRTSHGLRQAAGPRPRYSYV